MDEATTRPPMSTGVKVLFGCLGCLGVVIILGGILIAVNFDRIQSAFESAAEEMQELLAVQAVLREELGVPELEVNSVRDLSNDRYSLRLVVPARIIENREPETVAREMAFAGVRAHPHPEGFDRIQVVFRDRTGSFVQIDRRQTCSFDTEALLRALPPKPR